MRTGVSQATAVTYATEMIGITANTSFLLLDLREPEEYNLWRIKESINFPAPNIARDKMIPDLYRFKNQPEKLIIVYMLDERQGTQYAQMFTEKGFENLYLLSGGCEGFLEKYVELCEGRAVPVPKSQIAAEEAQR
jgi:centrosomal protein CEP41